MKHLPWILLLSLAGCSGRGDEIVVENPSPAIGADGKLVQEIGIELVAGQFEVFLERGCTLPCSTVQHFGVDGADQREIRVRLFRGRPGSSEVQALGTAVVRGIQPAPAGEQVDVLVKLDASVAGITLAAQQAGIDQRLTVKLAK